MFSPFVYEGPSEVGTDKPVLPVSRLRARTVSVSFPVSPAPGPGLCTGRSHSGAPGADQEPTLAHLSAQLAFRGNGKDSTVLGPW